ncbi:hypothetical protein NDU88_003761 [Pleurodeles waltl]|uniref:Uncharacterized protein n=1 Tax=Pleurodeles waltl TaxID=8319 RepID=A0AAV7RDV0_PLEWA|nr:hypothetical protein NDU88_003761 [Pleurodeles waltl]
MGRRYRSRTPHTLGVSPHPGTSDPEVIREETNPVLHLGDGRQRESLCAVTWIQKEELDGLADVNMGARVPNCVTRQTEEGTGKSPETLSTMAEGKPVVKTSESARGRQDESEAREAPNSNFGHAREEGGQFRCSPSLVAVSAPGPGASLSSSVLKWERFVTRTNALKNVLVTDEGRWRKYGVSILATQ